MNEATDLATHKNNNVTAQTAVTVIAVLLFVLVFSLFYQTVGPLVSFAGLIPPILAGLLLGTPAGGFVGLSIYGINILLYRLVAHYAWSNAVNENLAPGLLYILVGVIAGVIHYLVTHFRLIRVKGKS